MKKSQSKVLINKNHIYYLSLIIIAASLISIGFRTTSEAPNINISPCLLPTFPVPCTKELEQARINYTQTTYGFPAIYKITATSERIKPQPYMATTGNVIPFNLPALVSDVALWSILFLGVTLLVHKYRWFK